MCNRCEKSPFDRSIDRAFNPIIAAFLILALLVFAFAFVCGDAEGAEVKPVPLATNALTTESPVITKALGINKPQSHDIPKFDLPPAAEAAAVGGIAIGATLLVVGQVVAFLVVGAASLFGIIFLTRKLAPFGKVGVAIPKVIAGLDALVASHHANDKLAKAIHTRLSKVLPAAIVTPPRKASTRKKKVNATTKPVA